MIQQAQPKPFEREVLDRLITMETKLDTITAQCPPCQTKINNHDILLATIEASAKSAHHRIDSVYKIAGLISVGIGLIIQLISFASKKVGG